MWGQPPSAVRRPMLIGLLASFLRLVEASYFFFDKNPSTLLANSSENPNRALARE
jgi:hypothetical protein